MKLTILNLVRNALHRAREVEKRASIASAISYECARIWHEHNPEDGVGGISRCPYNPPKAKEEAAEATEKVAHLEKTYQFALETFIDETNDS